MRKHAAGWLVALALVALWAIAPENAAQPAPTPHWDFHPQTVHAAITPALTSALCPPYSVLRIYEDGTYACSPG